MISSGKPDYTSLDLPAAPPDRPYVLINMVTSADGKVDFEVMVTDTGSQVEQIVVTARSGDGKGDITFIIDGSLPKPGDLGKARRGRRRGR